MIILHPNHVPLLVMPEDHLSKLPVCILMCRPLVLQRPTSRYKQSVNSCQGQASQVRLAAVVSPEDCCKPDSKSVYGDACMIQAAKQPGVSWVQNGSD